MFAVVRDFSNDTLNEVPRVKHKLIPVTIANERFCSEHRHQENIAKAMRLLSAMLIIHVIGLIFIMLFYLGICGVGGIGGIVFENNCAKSGRALAISQAAMPAHQTRV